jgi:hypothetical protein
MKTNEAVNSLQRLLQDLEQAVSLRIWITNAESILKRIYPDREFDINSKLTFYYDGDSTKYNKLELSQLLTGYIKELEELGNPKNQEKNINQQINISQSVNINFIIDSLKEELNGKEIRELKEAYSSGTTQEEKRNKVIIKLKEFGSDLVTNVLASIVTNPTIISGL